MNQNYIVPNPWSIIEDGFIPKHVKSSESIFSIGNGAMGQRGNFEETYTGDSFQGSYIAGVYYPDKTKVGWWKNCYPEYFAKVLNLTTSNLTKASISSNKFLTAYRPRNMIMDLSMFENRFKVKLPKLTEEIVLASKQYLND